MTGDQVPLIKDRSELEPISKESPLPSSPMDQVVQLAKDPNFDKDNFTTLVEFMEKREERDAKIRYNESISKFQSECPRIRRTKQSNVGKYSPYDEVMFIIQPILSKHGISIRFSFPPSEKPKTMHVVGYVSVGSHEELSEFELAVHTLPKAGDNDARNTGATLSYAKRYCLLNALNIVTEDEDKDAAGLGGTITEHDVNMISALIGDIESESGSAFNMSGWKNYLGIDEFTPVNEFPKSALGKAVSSLRDKLNNLRRGSK